MVTGRHLAARHLFVTGGAGFLGRHVVTAARAAGWHVHAPTSGECDVRDATAVRAAVGRGPADAVVHLAYRRDERDTIVDGSRTVAEAAAAAGARLVHLSTDVVFAGRAEPYVEHDPPDPTIDYGRYKAEAEAAVLRACPGAVVVRTSLLYGTAPELSPSQTVVADALAGRAEVTFFEDEVRCPGHAADVAAAVLALVDRPDVTGPLHVAGPRALSRARYAAVVARELGLDPGGLRTSTIADAGLERPACVVLDTSRASALGLRVRDPLLGGSTDGRQAAVPPMVSDDTRSVG